MQDFKLKAKVTGRGKIKKGQKRKKGKDEGNNKRFISSAALHCFLFKDTRDEHCLFWATQALAGIGCNQEWDKDSQMENGMWAALLTGWNKFHQFYSINSDLTFPQCTQMEIYEAQIFLLEYHFMWRKWHVQCIFEFCGAVLHLDPARTSTLHWCLTSEWLSFTRWSVAIGLRQKERHNKELTVKTDEPHIHV